MRLYDLSKGAKIKADCFDEGGNKIGNIIIFDHVDGMYSYCTVEGTDQAVHLSVVTPLREADGYYVIDNDINHAHIS